MAGYVFDSSKLAGTCRLAAISQILFLKVTVFISAGLSVLLERAAQTSYLGGTALVLRAWLEGAELRHGLAH